MLRRILLLCLLALAPLGCSGHSTCGDADASCTRVLFIGNSYTSANDLPAMFAKLARSGGHDVRTGISASGGWSLGDHAGSPDTAAALASHEWTYVVLQEQSQIPAAGSSRQSEMYPSARLLVRRIEDASAKPIFFLTWAHRNGWPENRLASYRSMQSAISDAYLAIAHEQSAAVAPVGDAWSALIDEEPDPQVWQDDGSHPTAKGTYLAACVFYATIFRVSPEGLDYRADLPADEATRLQAIAAHAVFDTPAAWNLQ